MDKKTLRSVILIVAIAALVIVSPFAVSRLVFHRSIGASIFEIELLSAGRDSMDNGEEAWLAEKTAANAGEYRIPVDLESDYSTGYYGDEDMKYYVFNESSDTGTLILYFAGGTYIDQPAVSHCYFIDRLARNTGAAIIVPIYPKLPDHSAADVYPLLCDFMQELVYTRDYDKLIFMGDSAGGGMSLALAELLAEQGQATPDRLILISPWLDVTMSNEDMDAYESKDPKLDRDTLAYAGSLWAGELGTDNYLVSPINGDVSALGEICLYTGTRELLYPDICRFADMLEAAGHEYRLTIGKGMNHIWPVFQCYGLKEADTATAAIEADILR